MKFVLKQKHFFFFSFVFISPKNVEKCKILCNFLLVMVVILISQTEWTK
jgi:hypothetical protein